VVCTALHAGPAETEWVLRSVWFLTHDAAFSSTGRARLWVSRSAITVDVQRVHIMPTNERAPVFRIAAAEIVVEVIVMCITKSTVGTGMIQGRTLISVWDCLSTHRDKSSSAYGALIASLIEQAHEASIAAGMSTVQSGVLSLKIVQAARTLDNWADFVLSSIVQGVTANAAFKVKSK
jgi:hypothetical protein